MFASVPLSTSVHEGHHLIGTFRLLEVACTRRSSSGSRLWKAVENKGLPEAILVTIEGQTKKTRGSYPSHVVQILLGALTDEELQGLRNSQEDLTSLKDLLLRAKMPAGDAEAAVEKLRTAPKRPYSEEQTILRAQVALMFDKEPAVLKLRGERLKGTWIFSCFDGIGLMLDETSEHQTWMIWERLTQDYPEVVQGIWERTQTIFQGLDCGQEGNSSIILDTSAVLTSSGNCRTFQFEGERQRRTPVTDIRGLVETLLLVPGKRAQAFRSKVASVFVRCTGGDVRLVQEIERSAHVQRHLQQHCPEHPFTAFGEEASRGSSSSGDSAVVGAPGATTMHSIVEAAVAVALQTALPQMMAATLAQQSQRHGVLEITRSKHSEAEQHLLSIGTKVDDGHLNLISIEGGPLHLSVFLGEKGVKAEIIRRLTPTFSAEVKRRKLAQYTGEGPFWIAWSQGSWRPLYTEADRDLISEVFEDPLTKKNIEALQSSLQPARALPPASHGRLQRRAGPYSRALHCSSGEVTREALGRFFGLGE